MISTYYSSKEQIFMINDKYIINPKTINKSNDELIKENLSLVPRFRLKNPNIFNDFPANEPIKYDKDLFIKAISYGMILLISYKGDKDKWKGGRERTIYPMVLGRSKVGNYLIRGYHLTGWSISNGKLTDKIWRMFRADRIKTMTFTGAFFRLPPDGYKLNDKGMRGGIIKQAIFTEIRKNQQKLINSDKITTIDKTSIGASDKSGIPRVLVQNTKTTLDLSNVWSNKYISKKDAKNIRVCVLKSLSKHDEYIMIFGVLGTVGNACRIFDGDKQLGIYRVIDSFMANKFNNKTLIDNKTTFNLYAFNNIL